MRNVLIGFASAVALVSTMATYGCGGSSGGSGGSGGGGNSSGGAGNGGSKASGGNASGGAGSGGSSTNGGSGGSSTQPANCPNGSPCGGDIVGTWNVTSSCLKLSGDMDVSLAGMGCSTVPVTGSLQVTGSWTAKANGSYTDNTITTGSMTFTLSSSCLTVSSVPVECANIAGDFTSLGWKPPAPLRTANALARPQPTKTVALEWYPLITRIVARTRSRAADSTPTTTWTTRTASRERR